MTTSYALPAELTIYAVGALRPEWQQWVTKLPKRRGKASGAAIFEVDAAAVLEVDGAGVQLLVALSHSLAARRRTLRLVNVGQTLASACEVLGLSAHLLGTGEPS